MKYALISDIHGNINALQAVINDARNNNVHNFIFLGDYCIGLAYPNEVLDYIRSLSRIYAINGNEEDALINMRGVDPLKRPSGQFEAISWYYENLTEENKDFIFSLPSEIILKTNNVPSLYLFHKPEQYFPKSSPSIISPQYYAAGIDKNIFTIESFDDYCNNLLEQDKLLSEQLCALKDGVYIFGHKHIQWSKKINGKLLINPGSCGLSLDFQKDAAYAVLHFDSISWECELRRVKYDIAAVYSDMEGTKYAKDVPIWFRIISKELLTARGQAIPFLIYTEEYANKIGDSVRPFTKDTWYASFSSWINTI